MPASPPNNEVLCGDNLPLMAAWPDGCCDLIYADPPFHTGRTVVGALSASRYDDRNHGGIEGYVAGLRPRLVEFRRLLAASGSLYVHLDWRAVHYVKVMLDGIFGHEQFLNEIIWTYRSGGRSGSWFARKHDTILFYVKQVGRHTFHPQRGGAFRTRGLKHDAEGRPYKTTRNGRIHFHPDGPTVPDVWDIPIISTVGKERTGYPSQKPEALIERIIRSSTNEGDRVLDAYCGSGTTLAVAQRLGRRYFGCDINPDAVSVARQRLTAGAAFRALSKEGVEP